MSEPKLPRAITFALAALAAAALLAVPTTQAAGTTARASAGRIATSVALASSRPVAKYGDAGKITATVRPIGGRGIPTGSVDFNIDGGWYWNSPLDARGKATLPLTQIYPAFDPGPHSITADYLGDAGFGPSSSGALTQTLVGISEPPVSTVTTVADGRPVFAPRSFRLSSFNPVGCNVTIKNDTSSSIALVYGTPGNWKRLPGRGGIIAPGASGGVGVSLDHFTGYFSAVGAKNYVAIHCV